MATDYWKKRAEISEKMHEDLKKNLRSLHTDVTGFMLIKVDLPNEFETAIVQTEVISQEIITEETIRIVHESE